MDTSADPERTPAQDACLDAWPESQLDRLLLVLTLDREQRQRLRRVEPDPVRRARIIDRATDRLLARLIARPPERPRAWYSEVVRNLTRSRKHLPRSAAVSEREAIDGGPPRREPPESASRPWDSAGHRAWLRRVVIDAHGLLTDRQRRIVEASAAPGATNRSAARSVGETPRDLGRALLSIGARIRRALSSGIIPPPPSC